MLVLYPYKNALWALRPAKPLGVLSRHPCRNPKPFPRGERLCMLGWLCICATVVVCCRCVLHRLCSTTYMRPCIEPLGIHARRPCRATLLGLPPLDQAGMLAVSRTKPLHDAVAQMADDLYGGYAPATPFLSTIEVFRQSETAVFVHKTNTAVIIFIYSRLNRNNRSS